MLKYLISEKLARNVLRTIKFHIIFVVVFSLRSVAERGLCYYAFGEVLLL